MHSSRRAGLALILVLLLASACTGSSRPRQSPTPGITDPSVSLPPGSLPPSTVSARGKPNLIILLSDDQAMHLFNRQLMPHVFSQLVDQGANFSRAYVNVSLCCPSRASILTGLYSHNTGVQDNAHPLDGQMPLRPNFAQALHDAGYRTMMDGKYLNSEKCDPQPGWDQWVCGQEGNKNPQKHPPKFDGINPTFNIDGQDTSFQGYTTDILASLAVRFIDQNRDPNHPFLLYFTPHAPHALQDQTRYDPRYASMTVPQYNPPSFNVQPDPASLPRWVQRPPLSSQDLALNRQKLVKMTQQIPVIDNAVGRILDAIKDRADNTFVLYMTDNAFMYGEHRILGKVAPYEESVQTPFVIRYPKLVGQAFTTDALAENVDVAPTIMDLAGIPWEADGTSLVPVLSGRTTSVHDGLLLEHCEVDLSDRKCQHGQEGFLPPLWGVETGQYQYFEYSTGEAELYDLEADPYEMRNLANLPQYQSVRQQLSSLIQALRAPPPTPGTTIAIGPAGGQPVPGDIRFGFFTQARISTFQCRLEGPGQSGGWGACPTGQITYPSLSAGSYTFQVRAVDVAGRTDLTPAERTFTVSG